MALDPYASCPCGSGKKFKWCCQPIHEEIDRAFEQHNAGQAEAAMTAMKSITERNEGNPEAWGRFAQLLALNGKIDEADAAIEKAFAVNPNYAFGYLLRGQLRLQEGEAVGVLLFRKASELYASEAHEPLAYLHELIADIELRRNRPVAAKASLRRAVHLQPASEELRKAVDELFGDKARLPLAAKKDYTFRAPKSFANRADKLTRAAAGKLSAVRAIFQQLTESFADDPAGWFNLGLVQAWLGENAKAVEALEESVRHETEDGLAAEAWALAEVLRAGDGLEEIADITEHRTVFQLRDGQPVVGLLQQWEQAGRLVGMRADPERGLLTGLVLETGTTLAMGAAAVETAVLGAYLLVAGNVFQVWNSVPDNLEKLVADAEKTLGQAISTRHNERSGVNFVDVTAAAMLFPTKPTTELNVEIKVREQAAKYYEDTWVHRPLKSLGGVPPIDAPGHAVLRKKLLGVVQFHEECAELSSVQLYDFNNLRRKLGLIAGVAGGSDYRSMSAPELAALERGGMSAEQIGDAFRAAISLDARDLAVLFATELTNRPGSESPTDRLPFYMHLAGEAQRSEQLDEALQRVESGEKHDCEFNGGLRRNEFELRRGQLLAKKGDANGAFDVLDRLVQRVPDDAKVVGSATETMLSLKAGQKALGFAEKGLAQALAQNNRDSEQYFLELVDAARRLG